MGQKLEIDVNGKKHQLDADPETSLLEALREDLGMTGTKYGCGESRCGACTVLVDGGADPQLRHHHRRCEGREGADYRVFGEERHASSRPRGFSRDRRVPVRLLRFRHGDDGSGTPEIEPPPH